LRTLGKISSSLKSYLQTEAFQNFYNFFLMMDYIDNMLSYAKFHSTCYSTTLFDALRHGKQTFALMMEACRDYVGQLGKVGLVLVVQPNESVLDVARRAKIEGGLPLPNPHHFHSPYCLATIISRV
jgi:hypothetical protein